MEYEKPTENKNLDSNKIETILELNRENLMIHKFMESMNDDDKYYIFKNTNFFEKKTILPLFECKSILNFLPKKK